MVHEKELELFDKIDAISKDVKFIRYDISVNGSSGLETILREHHKSIKELNSITRPERTRKRLLTAIKEFVCARPYFSTIAGLVITALIARPNIEDLINWIKQLLQ